jgi:hypothetical protein
MPVDIASAFFHALESELQNAERDVDIFVQTEVRRWATKPTKSAIERNRSETKRWLSANNFPNARQLRKRITRIRAACFGQIALLTGMRLNEVMRIPYDAYSEEDVDGIRIGRICAFASKTQHGPAIWVAPTHLKRVFQLLVKLTEVPRRQVALELQTIDTEIGRVGDRQDLVRRRNRLTRFRNSAFLARDYASGNFDVVKAPPLRASLREIAASGQVGWMPRPHQLRRTFAVIVAHHAGGDLRFLKDQFKHWSLDMTLLYAQQDGHDAELASSIFAAVRWRHGELVRRWLETDAVLAGGGGERVSELRRSYQGGTSKNLEALVRTVSDDLMIRPTGHSWCLSGRSPSCGGRGLYDPPHCVSCASGVIGNEHLDFWGELRLQQMEAIRLADTGPGGMAAAIKGVQACDHVIGTLLNFKVTYGNRGSTPDRRHAAQTTNRARKARRERDDQSRGQTCGSPPQHHSHTPSRDTGSDSGASGTGCVEGSNSKYRSGRNHHSAKEGQ